MERWHFKRRVSLNQWGVKKQELSPLNGRKTNLYYTHVYIHWRLIKAAFSFLGKKCPNIVKQHLQFYLDLRFLSEGKNCAFCLRREEKQFFFKRFQAILKGCILNINGHNIPFHFSLLFIDRYFLHTLHVSCVFSIIQGVFSFITIS